MEQIALAPDGADRRERLAADLGSFLGCLNALRLPIATDLDVDPLGRANKSARIPRTRAALEHVAALWDGRDRAELIFTEAENLAPDHDPVIVHGDLNQRHALVSPSGTLAGVIDWGDLCQAPRQVDLPLYWSLFDPPARAAFRAAYGTRTETTSRAPESSRSSSTPHSSPTPKTGK
jgi:aminoglycoside phosphotransferase (APT) family kinase protein